MTISVTLNTPATLDAPNATTSVAGLMSATDKEKLDGIQALATDDQTGSEIVTAINATLGVDLATALEASGSGFSSAAQVIAALDSAMPDNTVDTTDPAWRRKYVTSVFGRDGDVVAETGDYTIDKITGLQAALDAKLATGGTIAESQVTGLVSDLAAKIAGLTVKDEGSALSTLATGLNFTGAGVTVTGTGAEKTVDIPATGNVTSVFGRTGAITAAQDDYTLAKCAEDATYKRYTATEQTKLSDATASATASKLVLRDASGRAQFADPSANGDAATKGWVNTLFTSNSMVVPVSYPCIPSPGTLTNLLNAETEIVNNRRHYLDLTGAGNMWLSANVTVAGVSGSKIYVKYSTDGGSNWTAVSGADLSLTSTGFIVTSSVAVPAGAKTDHTWIGFFSSGGDGVVDPAMTMLELIVTFNVPAASAGGAALTVKDEGSNLSTAVTSIDFVGAGVVATNTGGAVTATISSAASVADGAVTTAKLADAAVTLAKMANLAQALVIGRASGAGTGVPVGLAASDLRTLMSIVDGVSSFKTRTGAITPAANDYTADQITETSTGKILTAAERARIVRFHTVTRFTGSQIVGLNELFADYVGTTAATATLTTDTTCVLVNIANRSTNSSALTIVAGSGQTINGGNITVPAGTATSPATVCLSRDPSNNSWWQR